MVLKGYGATPLEYLEPNTNTSATVIFLHGMGSSGVELKEELLKTLGNDAYISHVKFIFPSAPKSYLGLYNRFTKIWYNVTLNKQICYDDARCSVNYIESIYKSEVKRGIDPKRIVVAGFSQGGCIALGFGYTRATEIRAVAVMSCAYSPQFRDVNSTEVSGSSFPELYQIHGALDSVITLDLARESFNYLQKNGVEGTFSVHKSKSHEMDKEKIIELYDFIKRVLRPLDQ